MPLAPEVMCNHETLAVAVQLQVEPAVTETLPVEGDADGLALVGLIEYVQPVPAVIVKFTSESSKY